MNRAKAGVQRRSSKPSAHPPPGDFIALGSKGSAETKLPQPLHKPSGSTSGLLSERKRETLSGPAPGSAGLSALTKRQKLGSSSSATNLGPLGRLAEAADAERRASSPSVREPVVTPVEVPPGALLEAVEAAEAEGNDERVEALLCGAARQLRLSRPRPDSTLCLALMYLAKVKPNIFATEGIIEALCGLLRRDPGVVLKSKGGSTAAILSCNLLMAAYEEDENWPEVFVKVYIEDSLGERMWVDSPYCKLFVDNIQTAFGTKTPCGLMLHLDQGRPTGGEASAGASPRLSGADDDKTLEPSELLIVEDKVSSDDDSTPVMLRYDEVAGGVQEYVGDVLREQLARRQPMDSVPRHLLRLLAATVGYVDIRLLAVQKLELWLQNPKLMRPAQDLLMAVCSNCTSHTAEDVEVISHITKIRLKPKPLLNHYMLCIRELLNSHKDNLGTLIKGLLFNELSNTRNPNNMQILYTVLQHVPNTAPRYLALVFQELLVNKEDFLRASRLLLREIAKQCKHEMDFQAFCQGLMEERNEPPFLEMECKERFVIQITDLLTLSMMLSITAQVKEAGIACDKGEKKNLEPLRTFQRQIAAIQCDTVCWLHTIVPTSFKLPPKDYVHCLYKVLFTEQMETYYKWDNWPPESDRNFFLRLCSEVPLLEDTLTRVLLIALSRDLPLGPADAMELADHLVKRAASVQADDLEVLRVEKLQLMEAVLKLATYHYPENIHLPPGYDPPTLAISNLYWKAWLFLLVLAAFNPRNIGWAAWKDYPTLKMLMEMVMTNNYSFPLCTAGGEELRAECLAKEVHLTQLEKQEILQFESHLAAASTKQTITETNSLLLPQLMALSPGGPVRRPPASMVEQLRSLNQSLHLGQLLCSSRDPDFLLSIIQRQGSSQSMPWLADLVEASEGSLDILPVQCLCEFLLHEAAEQANSSGQATGITSGGDDTEVEDESKEQRARRALKASKQRQLLARLQDLLQASSAELTTHEVLDYFLRRLSSPQAATRSLALQGLSMVLTPAKTVGSDGDEASNESSEELSLGTKLLPTFRWLLHDLPHLPVFRHVRGMTILALQQAIHVEMSTKAITAYLLFLAQHAQPGDQNVVGNLILDVSHMVAQRMSIMQHLYESDAVGELRPLLTALLGLFANYMRSIICSQDEESYPWTESQGQVFVRWASGETATTHIRVVQAQVILLTAGRPEGESEFDFLLQLWFSESCFLPTAFLVDAGEELLPAWLKLRMICSSVPRLVDTALRELEVSQLLLFVQSFGIPVCSMSELLGALDEAATHDPYTLQQHIMDKNYMAQLVEVQHERGAIGGYAFHSLLATTTPTQKEPVDMKRGVAATSGVTHAELLTSTSRPALFLRPDEDFTALLVQIFPPWSSEEDREEGALRSAASALQRSLAREKSRRASAKVQTTRGVAFGVLQSFRGIAGSHHAALFSAALFVGHAHACPIFRLLYLCQASTPPDSLLRKLFLDVAMCLANLNPDGCRSNPLTSQLAKYISLAKEHQLAASSSVALSSFLASVSLLPASSRGSLPGSVMDRALLASLRAHPSWAWDIQQLREACESLISSGSPLLEEFVCRCLIANTQKPGFGHLVQAAAPALAWLLLHIDQGGPLISPPPGPSDNTQHCTRSCLSPAGLLIDWLELLDPEMMSSSSDVQRKLLFMNNPGATGIGLTFRPYLLSLLTHQSAWPTIHCTINTLLGFAGQDGVDPSAVLDFISACVHVPRIWQGRDVKKRVPEAGLTLPLQQLLCLVDLIVAEVGSMVGVEARNLGVRARLSLLLGCARACPDGLAIVGKHLAHRGEQQTDRVASIRLQLLLHVYLREPSVSGSAALPDAALLNLPPMTHGQTCKLDGALQRLFSMLMDATDAKTWESRQGDAGLICRKLAVTHPFLLLRHLPMVSAMVRGRVGLGTSESRPLGHFSYLLRLLNLLQPAVFAREHSTALADLLHSLLVFIKGNRGATRPLADLLTKFVQFVHSYIGHDSGTALAFLQKHSGVLHQISAAYPELPLLKSLLAGLALPAPSGPHSHVQASVVPVAEEPATLLPLVGITAPSSLSQVEMQPLRQQLRKSRTIEDILEVLNEIEDISRRREDVIVFFLQELQDLLGHGDDACREMAYGLTLRAIRHEPRRATDCLASYIHCLQSNDFGVVHTALHNLPEFTVLCQEHATLLLQKAFLAGTRQQLDIVGIVADSLHLLRLQLYA
uniref:integrator complex subunit 1 n=1 Tax=Myxine glutinosa TaxID=7769 RepID=UPI00358F4073